MIFIAFLSIGLSYSYDLDRMFDRLARVDQNLFLGHFFKIEYFFVSSFDILLV